MVAKLKSLMISFGELDEKGRYAPTAGTAGFENAISRAGFDILPGVAAGEIAKAIKLEDLLASEYWKQTRFYQPSDFLWQQTIFQPVGGMDQVQRAFARQVATLGGMIHLNSPVTSIGWDAKKKEFVVQVARIGTNETIEYRADYCFSNIAMPFLEKILSNELRGGGDKSGFEMPFKQGLDAVFAAQARPRVDAKGEYQDKFLAATTKVGWQGDRTLWQGRLITHDHDDDLKLTTMVAPDSEEGVVPIFGGISWTSHQIVQIWYPSTAYHDRKGVLTGAYNFGLTACDWGKKTVDERLKLAREGARQFGRKFGNGLDARARDRVAEHALYQGWLGLLAVGRHRKGGRGALQQSEPGHRRPRREGQAVRPGLLRRRRPALLAARLAGRRDRRGAQRLDPHGAARPRNPASQETARHQAPGRRHLAANRPLSGPPQVRISMPSALGWPRADSRFRRRRLSLPALRCATFIRPLTFVARERLLEISDGNP